MCQAVCFWSRTCGRVHAAASITEKRGRNYEKVLGEWQAKASDVAAEVEASQTEGRNYSSELFRLKAAQDEAVEQLDIVKRENKVYTHCCLIFFNYDAATLSF